jgi:hypothetical protein
MTTRRRRLKSLLFSNPKFHAGTNVTVRDGDKWAKSLGQEVILKDADTDEAYGHADIVGVMHDSIGEIPDGVLRLEHDKDCTSTRGIWKEMERVYERAFGFKDKVTVLFFRVRDGEF